MSSALLLSSVEGLRQELATLIAEADAEWKALQEVVKKYPNLQIHLENTHKDLLAVAPWKAEDLPLLRVHVIEAIEEEETNISFLIGKWKEALKK